MPCRSTRSHHCSGGGQCAGAASGARRVAVEPAVRVQPPDVLDVRPLGQQHLRQRGRRPAQPLAVGHRTVQLGQRGAGPSSRRPAARERHREQLGGDHPLAAAAQHDEVVGAGEDPCLGELVDALRVAAPAPGAGRGRRAARRAARCRRGRPGRGPAPRRGRAAAARDGGPGRPGRRRRAPGRGGRRGAGRVGCCRGPHREGHLLARQRVHSRPARHPASVARARRVAA